MIIWIRKFLAVIGKPFAAPVFEGDENKTRTAALLNIILWTAFWSIAVASPILVLESQPRDQIMTAVVVLAFILSILGLVWMSHRGRVRLASTLFSALLLAVVTTGIFIFGGVRTTTTPAYLLAIFIAGLLLGWRAAVITGLLSALATLAILMGEIHRVEFLGETIPMRPIGIEQDPLLPWAATPESSDWFMLLAIFVVTTVVVSLAWRSIINALHRARKGELALSELNRELQASRDELQARTRDLERRSRQLEAAAEVFRDTTTTYDPDELLSLAANLVQTRFGFHHAAIFLLGERGEYAVLRAATGETGRRMLEQELQLSLEEESPVSYVINNNYYHFASRPSLPSSATPLRQAVQTEEAAGPSDEPSDETQTAREDLPPLEIHSELVLPLRVGRRVIGALDIHSREEAAFTEEDAMVLQTLADQLAIAIENCRLLNETQQAVHELEVASGHYTQEAWQAAAQRGGRPQGYRYRRIGVEPVADQPSEVHEAWQQGRSVVITRPEDGEQDGAGTVAVPVKLREQIMGVLNLRFEGDSIPAETVSLIEEVSSRLALALENARLLEETRRRAEQDRLTADITARVRASTNIDTILRTAIRELGQALRASDGLIRLGVETPAGEPAGDRPLNGDEPEKQWGNEQPRTIEGDEPISDHPLDGDEPEGQRGNEQLQATEEE